MIQFKKLRLTGFKSFVDHSELLINSGLTGVVGPNGCGKSNLVEALRWVMGETSAKQMRGGEMDDVIFAGSGNRPARNVAEVGLVLDNSDRTAPALFNNEAELQVTRRIERQKGSNYKVNGNDVRARDVQLLFADAATGARSTAMVSQGKIGAIISAKPQQRRMILEEAAGITGLHSRRHEAELRLRGAETNLGRLDDVLITLETQQKNLQKQARQASRYRTISDRIRKAESLLFHMRWGDALDEMDKARKSYKEAETRVNELTSRAAEASKVQAEASTHLPALREAEAAAGAELHRLSIAREQLDGDEKRLSEVKLELQRRLHQAEQDLERETDFSKDAQAAHTRLENERENILVQGEDDDMLREEALERLEIIKEEVANREERINELTEEVAQSEAKRNSLKNRLNELASQLSKLQVRKDDLQRQKNELEATRISQDDLMQAEARMEESRERQALQEEAIEQAEQKRVEARQAVQTALEHLRECEAVLAKLEAEEDALAELLDPQSEEAGKPILDDVSVEPGYEAALGSALGDDLSASRDKEATLHWEELPALKSPILLPSGMAFLSEFAKGPSELKRRLAQIGVVDTANEAHALQASLQQGQRIVSKEGGMWRWDGFISLPGAPSAAAIRLKQKNRLAEIRSQWEDARIKGDVAQERLELAKESEAQSNEAEKQLREELRQTNSQVKDAQNQLSTLQNKLASFEAKLENINESLERCLQEGEEVQEAYEETSEQLEELPVGDEGREQLALLREELAEKRNLLLDHQSAFERIARDAENRKRRLSEIGDEIESWKKRSERAVRHIEDLVLRKETLIEELETLAERPQEIEEKRQALFEGIERSEEKRKFCADKLAEAEGHLRDVDSHARQAETELAKCREERVRFESHVEQGKQLCQSLAERIRERLDCKPEELSDIAEIDEGSELPDVETAEKRVDRLHRERDTMGPVNLRAETELEELTEQVQTMNSERDDLLKAIDKLRQGINELNREGRDRLLTSFNEVNQHFQDLFTRLFGGGQAHLELIEDEDPLQAGLEIMASPPGKRMQILSLLSGGEQALTALALLFGVFLTNPAPICVLDEVDAPLDDANVDRFCTMLEEMAQSGHTRFLIITHHRMTMARMHRLFGVTMTERGVSQLVSVDLQKAEEMVDS
ncbi:Chromosome partition protein Smc [Candidatus Terasakiella magnetica]|uniref:Chromosome partition protein Smc n=1 Tax=Candidatus Terasakiella magnetica TaxID=1867952 RepID=A0A1C3RJC5_9PROT|nr:chromosome segregation protein SMC [Candidatus Terasakiella magnetica]SCA57384.1 Chromosome partition protein Smc [Candidatus Terasakiella magnetica]